MILKKIENANELSKIEMSDVFAEYQKAVNAITSIRGILEYI